MKLRNMIDTRLTRDPEKDIGRQWCRVCEKWMNVRAECEGRQINPGRWALFSCPFPHVPIGASDDEIQARLVNRRRT